MILKDEIDKDINKLKDKLDPHNDTLVLYQQFLEFNFLVYYTVGNSKEIEQKFKYLCDFIESKKIRSFANIKAIEAIILYYKSTNQHEKLIYITELLTSWKELIPRKRNYYETLSSLYYETLQFEKAINIYRENIHLCESNEILRKVSMLNNTGLAYLKLNQEKRAEKNFRKAFAMIDSLLQDQTLIEKEKSIINKYSTIESIKDFKILIEENLNLSSQLKTSTEEKLENLIEHAKSFKFSMHTSDINTFYKIAYLYSNIKKYEQSNVYLDSIEFNFRRSPFYPDLSNDIKKLRVFNNLKLGHIDLALNDLNLESIVNQKESSKYLAFSNYQKSNFDKEKEQIDIENNKNKTVGTAIFIIIISLISYYAYRTWTKKQIQQKKAEYRQKLITSIKEESDIKLKEADHRIMNSIQLVAQMASLEKMKGEKEFDVQAFQLKMMSIAEIHNMLQNNDLEDALSSKEYLTKIIDLLQNGLSFTGEIKMEFINECALDIDDLNNLGLITIELVINTIKHSTTNSDQICIEFIFDIKKRNQWKIKYQDNGNFDYDDFLHKSNYEASIIAILIESLSAKYKIVNKQFFNIEIYK
ncbi:MAG: histidine kinase dimerization/phosphoacceptor domain -containing protein [Flavobacteriales bacterium]